MRIWLIKVGEPLPIDGECPRLFRTGMLAHGLARRGHAVTWWSSTVNHVKKVQRAPVDRRLHLCQNLDLILMHSVLYKKNVSLSRIVNHLDTGRKFRRLAEEEPPPDVIVCSLPILELAAQAVAYGRRVGTPVVLDIRDMWPDIFLDEVPRWFRPLAGVALQPAAGMARYACRGAASILGITPAFVEWGVKNAGRCMHELDRCFYFAYDDTAPPPAVVDAANRGWDERGIGVAEGEFVACYFGAVNRRFEIGTVIDAARLLAGGARRIKVVLCGSGEQIDRYRFQARGLKNVVFPGWVNAADIWTLMRRSHVGLAPYHSSSSFVLSIPNKISEYLSAGLPVVSSLDGLLKRYLEDNRCGRSYANGDARGLADILCALHDEPGCRALLSQNARETFLRNHAVEEFVGGMELHLGLVHAHCGRRQARSGRS